MKMQSILITIFCYCSVFHGVTTQAPNTGTTQTLVAATQSNWEEFASSRQDFKEAAKAKKDKFLCVLNLLKTALSEELDNSQCKITEETTQESMLSALNSILEEKEKKKEIKDELEKQGVTRQNETDPDNAPYQKVIMKIATAFSKPQNDTNNQNNIEMPSLIPIFRPRHTQLKNEINQNMHDLNPDHIVKQKPKSRAISFVPEKIIQTNINPTSTHAMFNIPCQRAADVLDMTNIGIPKAVCDNVKPKVNPVVESPKVNSPNQIPAPVTLSVKCTDSDDTVAMLFKPKDISLMQLYGNLLKKITITVLVPYHMSQLSGK